MNQPTLEIAHETILSGWKRLRQWIQDHAEALRIRRDLEQVAAEWGKAGRHRSALRSGRLLKHYRGAAESNLKIVGDYLIACKYRQYWNRAGAALLVLVLIVVLILFIQVSKSDFPPSLAAKALFVQRGIWPVIEPEMEGIRPGQFEMGDQNGDFDELYVRTVSIMKFEMGKHEVTFDEYDLFAAATRRGMNEDKGWRDKDGKRRGQLPAINVAWDDAVAYAEWLSDRRGLKEPNRYRLPSEAEWEYAARAGTTTKYALPAPGGGSNDIERKNLANCTGCGSQWDDKQTAPVRSFESNDWNLHDMHGNVSEWTQDCYVNSYRGAPVDGSARESDDENSGCSYRVLRGGSWDESPHFLRSAIRTRGGAVYRHYSHGFRLARTL